MDGVVAYILSKKFTKDSLIGIGAIKGAPCQVQSVEKVGKTTTVTLKWVDDLDVAHTQSFDIEDGLDGVSVTGATINSNGHLILTLSNTDTIDCGKVVPQYDTMPSPSASNAGSIFQYIGNTTQTYTNGYFYKCVENSGNYSWEQCNVQPSPITSVNGKTGVVVLNAQDIGLQYNSMPVASVDYLNDVVQYIGATSQDYTNGYFYKCIYDTPSSSYKWVVANNFALLDDVYTKSEIGDLSNLPYTDEDVVENISALNTNKEDIFRYSTMPVANASYVGFIAEYIGTTTSNYINGYFYQCREISTGVYAWVQKNVQPSGGGTGGDGVIDGYYNETDHLFYEEDTYINPISGDTDTLYVSLDTNLLYRYDSANSIFIRVDAHSDGQTIQVDELPQASSTLEGKIYQYVGLSGDYINGYFYACIYDSELGVYKWSAINTQDSYNKSETYSKDEVYSKDETYSKDEVYTKEEVYTKDEVYSKDETYSKEEIGDITDLPDNQKDIVENISDIAQDVSDLKTDKQDVIQFSTMPTANADTLGDVVQFVGTTGTYTNGYFYRCVYDGSAYSWELITDFYTKSEIGALSGLPDTTKDVIQNISLINSNKQKIMQFDTLPIASASNVDDIVQYTGTSNPNYINGYFYKCVLDGSSYKWENIEVQSTSGTSAVDSVNGKTGTVILDAEDIGLQAQTMPTANADNLNRIVQYIGTTNQNYTNGRFYKCVYDGVSVYSWVVAEDYVEKSNTAGLIKNDGTIDTTKYAKEVALAQEFSDVTNYVEGNYVTYQGDLYKFTSNHNAGAWDSNDVTKVDVVTLLGNKVDKLSSAVDGNFAGLNSSGNITDSGKKPSDFIEKSNTTGLVKNDGSIDTTTYIPTTEKGANSGVATLDTNGKVPSSQLPSYVDDVVEGYYYNDAFYEDIAHTIPITGETGKIYVDLATNKTYRWSGSVFVEISSSLALGETHSTAYYGDYGKTAYDHSQIVNGTNPHGTTANNVNLATSISVDGNTKTQVEETLNALNTLSASNKTALGTKYDVDDTAETDIADGDYVPFYDTSATAKRKTLWSNIKSVLKSYFDTLYATITTVNSKADKVTSATNNDIALLDASGNLKSSELKTSNFERLYNYSTTEATKNANSVTSGIYTCRDDVVTNLPTSNNTWYMLISQTDSTGTRTVQFAIPLSNSVGNAYKRFYDGSSWGLWESFARYSEITSALTNLAPAFSASSAYSVGTYVTYNGFLYKFTSAHTAGTAWNSSEVTLVTVTNELTGKATKKVPATNGNLASLNASGDLADSGILSTNVIQKSNTAGLVKNDGSIDTNTYATTASIANKADLTDLAPAFSSSTSYVAGQYVTYNGDFYRCTANHNGAWNSNHFTQVTVGSELQLGLQWKEASS